MEKDASLDPSVEATQPLLYTQPSPPRRKRSVPKCVAITCIIFSVVLFAAFLFLVGSGIYLVIDNAKNPHKELYISPKEVTSTPSNKVVLPLFDRNMTFDVAYTVFTRLPHDQADAEARIEEYKASQGEGYDVKEDELTAQLAHTTLEDVVLLPREEVLWSGIALEGVSLDVKSRDFKLAFDLPLERFYDEDMGYSDLRLGVVLLPTKGSKFDRLEAWSDWKPPSVQVLPKVAPNLLEERYANEANAAEKIEAIEHLGFSLSLLELYDSTDNCTANGNSTTSDDSNKEDAEDDDIYSIFATEGEKPKPAERSNADREADLRKKRAKKHPYFTKRSHVYILDETRPMHRAVFDKKHKELKDTSCGQSSGRPPSRWLCINVFALTGHWKTRFGILPAEKGGRKEVAYGPHMTSLRHASGPLDLEKMPISRGNCSGVPRDRSNDTKVLRVEHTVRFSSLTPGRVHLLEEFNTSRGSKPANATMDELVQDHNTWQQIAGLLGDKTEGYHPWRRLFVSLIAVFGVSLPTGILTCVYWYTRPSSTSINHSATITIAIGAILNVILQLAFTYSHTGEWVPVVMTAVFEGWMLVPAALMLKVVWPLEWIPGKWAVRRATWNHRERQTMRVEKQVPWVYKVALYLAIFALYWLPGYYDIHVIAPQSRGEKAKETVRWILKSWLPRSFVWALAPAGWLIQLEHNRRSGYFAGQFGLVAHLALVGEVLELLWFVPAVMGKVDTNTGVAFSHVVRLASCVWASWQAATLKRPEMKEEADAEEE